MRRNEGNWVRVQKRVEEVMEEVAKVREVGRGQSRGETGDGKEGERSRSKRSLVSALTKLEARLDGLSEGWSERTEKVVRRYLDAYDQKMREWLNSRERKLCEVVQEVVEEHSAERGTANNQ